MTRPLFEHLEELGEELAGSAPIWLGTDFDGTLTHHQDDPSTVTLSDAMRQKLAGLADNPRFAVAVVSGRSLDDLMPRVGLGKLAYAGNHGLEIEAPGLTWTDPEASKCRGILGEFSDVVGEFIRAIPCARLENKRLSLAIDYRPCALAVRRIIVARLDSAAARFPTLRLRHTPLGSEVLPKAGGNKGTATQVLHDHQLAGAGIAIYLGDDLTDEDAFRALANAVTIHVGHRETAARFRVESSNRVAEFFDWLIQTARREQ